MVESRRMTGEGKKIQILVESRRVAGEGKKRQILVQSRRVTGEKNERYTPEDGSSCWPGHLHSTQHLT